MGKWNASLRRVERSRNCAKRRRTWTSKCVIIQKCYVLKINCRGVCTRVTSKKSSKRFFIENFHLYFFLKFLMSFDISFVQPPIDFKHLCLCFQKFFCEWNNFLKRTCCDMTLGSLPEKPRTCLRVLLSSILRILSRRIYEKSFDGSLSNKLYVYWAIKSKKLFATSRIRFRIDRTVCAMNFQSLCTWRSGKLTTAREVNKPRVLEFASPHSPVFPSSLKWLGMRNQWQRLVYWLIVNISLLFLLLGYFYAFRLLASFHSLQTRVIDSKKKRFEYVSTSSAFLYGSRVPEARLAQFDLFAQLQLEGSFVQN